MNKRTGVFSVMLFCFVAMVAYGQDSFIRVEIKPEHAKVNNYVAFPVATTIRNTGAAEQSVKVWSCTFPTQWVADNPLVHVNLVGCKKNELVVVKLNSGKVLKKVLSVRVELDPGGDPVESATFRLGFKAATFETGQENVPIWSQPVTVRVTK